jgi:hypothetical protein
LQTALNLRLNANYGRHIARVQGRMFSLLS